MAIAVEKGEILRAVRTERARGIAFLRSLTREQWEVEVVPRWRSREVAAHFIALDITAVNGAILPVAFSNMEKLERWNDKQVAKRADRPVEELLVSLERWGRRFHRFAKTVPARLYRTRMPTLWGKGPGGLLIWSRAYDEYIHRQDIRRALGLDDEDADLASVAQFQLAAGAAHVLPQLSDRRGRVELQHRGVPIPRHVYDLAAGDVNTSVEESDADARIVAEAPAAFLMAAAGREPSFDGLAAEGRVTIEGDTGLAKEFLSRFRIV